MRKRYFISAILDGFLIFLTHEIWLGKKISPHFDFLILVIILILGFLFFLKITSYLADFKQNKKISAVEIVFVFFFVLICILPAAKLDKSDSSSFENRTLEKYKPFIKEDFSINKNYGKDFDNWFSDRIFARKGLIIIEGTIRYFLTKKIFVKNGYMLNKKNNWTISTEATEKLNHSNEEIKEIIHTLKEIEDYSKKLNTKTYILFVPTKSTIYFNEIGYNLKGSKERALEEQELIKIFQKNTSTKIIYPYNELFEASKKDYVYFKAEHHWTDLGAYIGYQALSKEIKKDFPEFRVVSLDEYNKSKNNMIRASFNRDYHLGKTADKFPISKKMQYKLHDVEYTYFKNKNKDKLILTRDQEQKTKKLYYPNKNNLKILLIGTSMGENLLDYLSYGSKHTLSLRLNTIETISEEEGFKFYKRHNSKIQNFKPDIIVFCLTFPNLQYLKYLFRED